MVGVYICTDITIKFIFKKFFLKNVINLKGKNIKICYLYPTYPFLLCFTTVINYCFLFKTIIHGESLKKFVLRISG